MTEKTSVCVCVCIMHWLACACLCACMAPLGRGRGGGVGNRTREFVRHLELSFHDLICGAESLSGQSPLHRPYVCVSVCVFYEGKPLAPRSELFYSWMNSSFACLYRERVRQMWRGRVRARVCSRVIDLSLEGELGEAMWRETGESL